MDSDTLIVLCAYCNETCENADAVVLDNNGNAYCGQNCLWDAAAERHDSVFSSFCSDSFGS